MNIGSAASAQDVLWPHKVVAMIGPMGALDRRNMPNAPVTISAKATHTPAPSRSSKVAKRTKIAKMSVIRRASLGVHLFDHRPAVTGRLDGQVNQRQGQDQQTGQHR